MDKKENKKNLALVRLRKDIKPFEDMLIPDVFGAPTSSISCLRDMRDYIDGSIKSTFCTVMEDYRRINSRTEKVKHKPLKPLTKTKALQRLFSGGGILEEYRKEKGLDKLRKALIEGLVKAASFEGGVDIVYEHLMSPENVYKENRARSDEAAGIAAEREGVIDGKLEMIALYYPELTADELAWISLTVNKKKKWIIDEPSLMYWPYSLIEMDLDGLVFAAGMIDERDYEHVETADPHERGGITGINGEIDLFRFHPNVAQIIKALVLLSIDDNDLYDKLWKEEDLVPVIRGDGLLIESFNGQNISKMPIEEIVRESDGNKTCEDLSTIRNHIIEFYNKSYFDSPHIKGITDFVKLIGTLERVPKFVAKKKPFRGYVRIYGTDINFINESGKIIDSVPIVPHLAHRVAYQFHDRLHKLDRKDEILREIFEELVRGISEKNYREKNQMPIDITQDQILEQGIFIANQIHTRIEKMQGASFYFRKYTSPERLVRTVKFGFDELMDIKKLLDKIPNYLKKGVVGITKRTSDYEGIRDVLIAEKTAGSYDPKNKIITLSLPIQTPTSKNDTELLLRGYMCKTAKTRKMARDEKVQIELFRILFCQSTAHEIAESVYASNKNISQAWKGGLRTKIPKNIPREERRKYFLTAYGVTKENEDFADTFAMYLLFGDQFRGNCVHPVIKEKYEFMKKLFSLDGQKREFKDKFAYSMYSISSRPEIDLEEKIRMAYLREELAEEYKDDECRRLEAGLIAHSYEDVEDVIRRYENEGIPISAEEATKIFSEENEQLKEALEENIRKRAILDGIKKKTLLMGYSSSFRYEEFLVNDYSKFQRHMLDGDMASAQRLLQDKGVPEKSARYMVKTLMPIYKNVGDVIEENLNNEKEFLGSVEWESIMGTIGELIRGSRRRLSSDSKDIYG